MSKINKKIGLVIGSGTGRELGEVFKYSLNVITQMLEEQVEVVEFPYEFKTYKALRLSTLDQIRESVCQDLEALISFYKSFYQTGGRIIFRTAINAETLYLFRRIGKAVKVIQIPLSSDKTLLIVRDEMQGFYTNDEYQIKNNTIYFTGSFSKENIQLITNFALLEAKQILGELFDVWIVYKHHLFANILENWFREFIPNANFYQPNHATELLFQCFNFPLNRNILMITGNEVGDILHEVLIFHLGLGTRSTLFSKNVYLAPDYSGLVEYQTVHGSADDIAGYNIVNPFATLRIVAVIVEKLFNKRFINIMENALQEAQKTGIMTPDLGGQSKTNEVVKYILSYCEESLLKSREAKSHERRDI